MGITNFDIVQANMFLGGTPGMGFGNVYYVVQTTNTIPYAEMDRKFRGKKYSDSSLIMHTTIQSALDATVANRNDYVIVLPDPSDYDITAALTMSKARTHLICPAGLGWKGMPPNMVRIHQTTASTAWITVTADTVEIAGFFFKDDGSSRGDMITLSGTRWHPHIHDNFFGMSATASTANTGIAGAGAVNHPCIHDNYFTNYSPGVMSGTDNDIASFIGITSASSTRGIIKDNIMTTGHNTAVAVCIQVSGANYVIADNYLYETQAHGASQTGTITLGIRTAADCMIVNNRIGMATVANGVIGGTSNESYVENWDSTGTLLV